MKKTIVRFMLWVECIPKRKRNHVYVKLGLSEFTKKLFDEKKEEITKNEVAFFSDLIKNEVANKSIKDVKSAYIVIREVELDGDFETYMPFDDVRVKITIPV